MKEVGRLRLLLLSPDEILLHSGGEVTLPECNDDLGSPVPGGLFDPGIFGTNGRKMGHITLAYPVLHPWFTDSVKAILDRDELPDAHDLMDMLAQLDLRLVVESAGSDSRGSERARLARGMLSSGIRPEWMILTILPVVQTSLRPVVRLSEGQFAGSDLNELYGVVIARNNRLKAIADGPGGNRLMESSIRMLGAAVEALLCGDNTGLMPLTEMLTSRNGLLNRNLQGKRQDHSGRSVLVSGPDLKLDECGIPFKMAQDLFRPFAARKLVQLGCASDVGQALDMLDSDASSEEVRRAIRLVADERLILLNRAPTFHRMSIQPFRPVLVEHKSIAMHPLATYAFNADFDGDQAALFAPMLPESLDECRHIIDAGLNLVSPGTGQPVASPVQDMVLGLYYLTADPHDDAAAHQFESAHDVVQAVDEGLGIHQHVTVPTDAGIPA